jgi:molecular chaperone DnaK
MRRAAEEHAEEDRKLKESIDKLNAADNLIFSTRKQLDEHGSKVSDGTRQTVEDALAKLETIHKSGETDGLEEASAAVNAAMNTFSQEVYSQANTESQQGAAQGADDTADAPKKGDGAVDADFEVVDEKKP